MCCRCVTLTQGAAGMRAMRRRPWGSQTFLTQTTQSSSYAPCSPVSSWLCFLPAICIQSLWDISLPELHLSAFQGQFCSQHLHMYGSIRACAFPGPFRRPSPSASVCAHGHMADEHAAASRIEYIRATSPLKEWGLQATLQTAGRGPGLCNVW